MKLTIKRILLIFLSFHSILNIIHNLSNYENFEIAPETKEYFYYQIKYDNSSGLYHTPYILISFTEEVEFGDIDEETGEEKFITFDKDNWLIFPLSVISDMTLNLVIRNNNSFSANFIFIDYSKEINLDFEAFINWNHLLKIQTDLIPEPIIFNIDKVENNYIISFNTNAKGEIMHDTNLLLYCINEGDECIFKELNILAIQKGKKYKFKLNPYRTENELSTQIKEEAQNLKKGKIIEKVKKLKEGIKDEKKDQEKKEIYFYYFKPIEIDFFCKELEFGNNIFEIKKNMSELYFIINTKEYEKIYYHINHNSENFNYAYINGKQKENIIKERENIHFEKENTRKLVINNVTSDYLFIKIKYNYDIYKGNIYITNELFNHDLNFNIIIQNDINKVFNIYGPDSIFMRTSSIVSDFGFNTTYIFGLDEEYYLYAKRLFGNVEVYQLNKELDEFSNLEELQKPIQSYETNDYKLITNKLIIMSGYQIFSYFNSYNSLYDIYMQKVNDLEHVQLNPKMFKFGNLVKLFRKNKQYYLDFTVDHYIKIDSEFLNAEVIFTDKNNNREYKLNGKNKVIKNLSGDNIIVKSNEDALVYFYKIIPEDSTIIKKEFNKTKTDKIMRIDIINKNFESETNVSIIKDFGFLECYPITSEKNWEIKNSISGVITAYFENYYDKLEKNLYDEDEEKYIIYIFESLNENNLPIFNESDYTINFSFVDSFLTKGNKYNFEVVSRHFGEQQYLLFSKNKPNITYQFMICENNEIDFIISNLNWEIFIFNTIDKNDGFTQKLSEEETLIHEIISNNDSLFAYQFHNPKERNEGQNHKMYSILSTDELEQNLFLIHFSPAFTESLVQYHMILAKTDNLRNIDTFSNPCYLANLMTHNSDKIITKTFFEESKLTLLSKIIDLKDFDFEENDKFVISIISNNLHPNTKFLAFYEPKEFSIKPTKYLSFNLEEKTKFDFDEKNIFKFDYINKYNSIEYLIFNFEADIDFILFITDGITVEEKQFYKSENNLFEIKLEKSGIYYFKFYNESSDGKQYNTFFVANIRNIIEIEKEQVFNFSEKRVNFDLPLNKKSGKNEMLLLYYKLEESAKIIIEITGPNGNKESFNISKQEGFKNFLYDKSGTYKIYFKNDETNYLKENNNKINGLFKMMSTESAFDLDITKDDIEFEEFNISRDEPPILKFKVNLKDKDYIKKISISNTNFNEINGIVSIKKNDEENKNLNFHYYTFEKNTDYIVSIKFKNKSENKYTLEKFNIISFSSNNIKEISSEISSYNNIVNNDEFLIIKWKNIKKIEITKINKKAKFLKADINEKQSKNLYKEFQNINFTNLTDLTINSPKNFDYSVLMVEILENETEIFIDIDKKKDDKGLSTGYIILISVAGLLFVIILLFFVFRCIKKRSETDFSKKAQEINQEKLLADIE